jgi:hypothetical protein
LKTDTGTTWLIIAIIGIIIAGLSLLSSIVNNFLVVWSAPVANQSVMANRWKVMAGPMVKYFVPVGLYLLYLGGLIIFGRYHNRTTKDLKNSIKEDKTKIDSLEKDKADRLRENKDRETLQSEKAKFIKEKGEFEQEFNKERKALQSVRNELALKKDEYLQQTTSVILKTIGMCSELFNQSNNWSFRGVFKNTGRNIKDLDKKFLDPIDKINTTFFRFMESANRSKDYVSLLVQAKDILQMATDLWIGFEVFKDQWVRDNDAETMRIRLITHFNVCLKLLTGHWPKGNWDSLALVADNASIPTASQMFNFQFLQKIGDTSSIMKCNTWDSEERCGILSGYAQRLPAVKLRGA